VSRRHTGEALAELRVAELDVAAAVATLLGDAAAADGCVATPAGARLPPHATTIVPKPRAKPLIQRLIACKLRQFRAADERGQPERRPWLDSRSDGTVVSSPRLHRSRESLK